MVRKFFVTSIVIASLLCPALTVAKNLHYNVENFYSKFQVLQIKKLESCGPAMSKQKVHEVLYKKISISADEYKGLWGSLPSPNYTIWHDQPSQEEEGVVEPKYIQRLFKTNGEYWDSITILTISSPKTNDPYDYLEIVDKNTLLLESGCWVYTLKRIKE